MVTLQLLFLGVFLLGSTHAQFYFCDNATRSTRINEKDVRVESHVEYFNTDPRGSERTVNNHDFVEGSDCEGRPVWDVLLDWDCILPPSTGFVSHDHGYYFPSNMVITCIKALDRIETGKGGFPIKVEGGVGQSMVRLLFYGQERQGMMYHIEIYYKYR